MTVPISHPGAEANALYMTRLARAAPPLWPGLRERNCTFTKRAAAGWPLLGDRSVFVPARHSVRRRHRRGPADRHVGARRVRVPAGEEAARRAASAAQGATVQRYEDRPFFPSLSSV